MDSENPEEKSIEELKKELEQAAKLEEAIKEADKRSGELAEGIPLTPETLAMMQAGAFPGMVPIAPDRSRHHTKKYIPKAKRKRIRQLQREARKKTRGKYRG